MIRGEITRLADKLVSLYIQIENADLTLTISGSCWTYSSAAPLEYLRKKRLIGRASSPCYGPYRETLRLMITPLLGLILTLDGHFRPITLPIPDHTLHQTPPSLVFHCLRLTWRTFRPSFLVYLIPQPFFQDPSATHCFRLVPIISVFRFRSRFPPRFQELWRIALFVCLDFSRHYLYRMLNVFMKQKHELWSFVLHYETFKEQNRSRCWTCQPIS